MIRQLDEKKMAAARERAERRKKLIRWIPEEMGEELVGELIESITYQSKKFGPLTFYQFRALAGSGNFTRNNESVDLQEIIKEEGEAIVEVPAQGHLSWYIEENFGGQTGPYLIIYEGKREKSTLNSRGESETVEFHSYTVEILS